jgi:hypothetical protein
MVSLATRRWHRPLARLSAGPQGRRRKAAPGRFTCPRCKREYGDPWYHGPIGHAPQQLCFDCWAAEWDTMSLVMSRGGNWQQLDAALYLLCQGFSHREAADLIGVSRNTVCNYVRKLRQRPELTPDWLIDRAQCRESTRR